MNNKLWITFETYNIFAKITAKTLFMQEAHLSPILYFYVNRKMQSTCSVAKQ